MSREKQIEEMAKVLERVCDEIVCSDYHMNCDLCQATYLYNAGYRKVIKCKNCTRCNNIYPIKEKGKEAEEARYCSLHKCYVRPKDFCSFAKMKGGE